MTRGLSLRQRVEGIAAAHVETAQIELVQTQLLIPELLQGGPPVAHDHNDATRVLAVASDWRLMPSSIPDPIAFPVGATRLERRGSMLHANQARENCNYQSDQERVQIHDYNFACPRRDGEWQRSQPTSNFCQRRTS